MSIVALVEFRIAPDRIDEARAVFDRILVDTRGFDGAERIDWLVDRDDPALWTSTRNGGMPRASRPTAPIG